MRNVLHLFSFSQFQRKTPYSLTGMRRARESMTWQAPASDPDFQDNQSEVPHGKHDHEKIFEKPFPDPGAAAQV